MVVEAGIKKNTVIIRIAPFYPKGWDSNLPCSDLGTPLWPINFVFRGQILVIVLCNLAIEMKSFAKNTSLTLCVSAKVFAFLHFRPSLDT